MVNPCRPITRAGCASLTPYDEVEDLRALLAAAKEAHPELTAVCAGAILSDYQRLRVEAVCADLGGPLCKLDHRHLKKAPQQVFSKISPNLMKKKGKTYSFNLNHLVAVLRYHYPSGVVVQAVARWLKGAQVQRSKPL